MQYILFTYDAIKAYMADRKFQSIDFTIGEILCEIILGAQVSWSNNIIHLERSKEGLIFYTDSITKKEGLLFDLTTFGGFEEEKDNLKKISSILQKVFRYAVKYFENLYLSQNEKHLKDPCIALVYPYPYTRNVGVPKVVIDRNNWKECKRKEYNFLTVYDYQTTDKKVVNYTALKKALGALQNISIHKSEKNKELIPIEQLGYVVTGLEAMTIQFSANIGIENWQQYLTNAQKSFIEREINGPERLEGAAGSGKTLTMCLRVIRLLVTAKQNNQALNLIYFTHSTSTKEIILDLFSENFPDFNNFLETEQGRPLQSVKVCTLQEWCADHLGINDLNENEYLDKDAGDSKLLQLMHIEEAWLKIKDEYWDLMFSDLSNQFKSLIAETSETALYELLQREFSEIIKGQAKSKLDNYLKLPRTKFSMPLVTESDKRYVYTVFNFYQQTLDGLGQFDSDDIVITALGQIDAPIWNRRRITEGYDACFIDETHLFNLNEISVFHFVNKPDKRKNIVFCIDRSQSIGDAYRADTSLIIDENGDSVTPRVERFSTLFRSAPDVASLAFSILTSGAAMFATLENPLVDYSAFPDDFSMKSEMPKYYLKESLTKVVEGSFEWVQNYCDRTSTTRNKTLLIATDEEILKALLQYADAANKPYIALQGRKDQVNIKKAINDNRFIIASIDYIGGLEFDAIAIVGIDSHRVPPKSEYSSQHIINFAWFNRLYVAVTRAKYSVALFGESTSGLSPLLKDAINDGTLIEENG